MSLIALAALLLVWLPVSIQTSADNDVPQGTTPRPVGPISAGVVVEQRFPALGDRISDISLLLATYQRVNKGTLQVTLQALAGGNRTTIATRTISKEQLADNSFYRITFSPPLRVQPSEALALVVQADGDTNQAITCWTNPSWTHGGYLLTANQQDQAGALVFNVRYARLAGPLWQVAFPLWSRLTVFLNPLWQAILLIGLGLTLLSLTILFLGGRVGFREATETEDQEAAA